MVIQGTEPVYWTSHFIFGHCQAALKELTVVLSLLLEGQGLSVNTPAACLQSSVWRPH